MYNMLLSAQQAKGFSTLSLRTPEIKIKNIIYASSQENLILLQAHIKVQTSMHFHEAQSASIFGN